MLLRHLRLLFALSIAMHMNIHCLVNNVVDIDNKTCSQLLEEPKYQRHTLQLFTFDFIIKTTYPPIHALTEDNDMMDLDIVFGNMEKIIPIVPLSSPCTNRPKYCMT